MAEVVGSAIYELDVDDSKLIKGTNNAKKSNTQMQRDFDKTDKSVTKLSTSFTKLGTAITAALSVTALNAFIKSTADALDVQAKFADRIGASFEELQKLQFAASQTGVSVNSLNTGLQRMSRRLETVAQGGAKNVADQLERMGITIEDLQGLAPEEQIRIIADGFTTLTTDAERTTAAFALFDTEGVALVNTLKNGSQALDDYGQQLQSIGGVISRETAAAAEAFNDQLDIMQRSATGAGAALLGEMLPAIKTINGLIIEFLANGESLRTILDGIGVAAQTTAAVVAGKFVSAIVSKTVSTIADTKATIDNRNAAIASAKAETDLLRLQQASLAAQLKLAQTERTRTALRVQLAANTAALTAANNALVAAQARAITTTNALSFATRGLGTAMAFLGGPVGVIIALTAGIALYNASMEKGTQRTKELKSATDEYIGSVKSLNAEQAKTVALDVEQRRLKLIEQISEAERNLTEQRERSNKAAAGGGGLGSAALAAADFGKAESELARLRLELEQNDRVAESVADRIKELETSLAPSGGATKGATAEELENVITLLCSIREEQALLASQEEGQSFASGIIQRGESPSEKLALEYEQLKALRDQDLIDVETYEKAKTQIEREQADERKRIQSELLMASSNFFEQSADLIGAFAGESSGAYKALFAVAKGFAIANAAIQMQTAIANALALPFPANIPAMAQAAALGGQIASNVASINYGGGRENGGPVSANTMYQMGENNKPEVLQTGSGLFAVPGDSGRVFNQNQLEQIDGNQGGFSIVIQNEPGVVSMVLSQTDREAIIKSSVNIAEQNTAQQLRNGTGKIGTTATQRFGTGNNKGYPT